MANDPSRYLDAEARLWHSVGVEPDERRVTLASGGQVRVQEVGEGPPVVFIHGGAIAGASWCHLAAKGSKASAAFSWIARDADSLTRSSADRRETSPASRPTPTGSYRICSTHWNSTKLRSRPRPTGGVLRVPGSGSGPRSGDATGRIQLADRRAERSGSTHSPDRSAPRHAGAHEPDADATPDGEEGAAPEVRCSPKQFTPIKGQNLDVLLSDALLSNLTMPVLFLWGENDPNGGAAIARAFAPRLPNAELVIVPGAEHAPWIDDVDLCAERTQAFLSR